AVAVDAPEQVADRVLADRQARVAQPVRQLSPRGDPGRIEYVANDPAARLLADRAQRLNQVLHLRGLHHERRLSRHGCSRSPGSDSLRSTDERLSTPGGYVSLRAGRAASAPRGEAPARSGSVAAAPRAGSPLSGGPAAAPWVGSPRWGGAASAARAEDSVRSGGGVRPWTRS